MDNQEVLLVGTGDMAIAYAQVLKSLNVNLKVIGRSVASAERFTQITGVLAISGGVEQYLEGLEGNLQNTMVIISVGTEMLMPTLINTIKFSPNQILIEKPGALSIDELLLYSKDWDLYGDKTFVAYNRRFYSSVKELKQLIKNDGGLHSMHFEFTEWAHTIEPLKKFPGVKENWLFANSTHVIDLAFHLSGNPINMASFTKKSRDISWHKNSIFVGAGITSKNVAFSYSSNWESAGRWSIELMTIKNRYYLKPLEQLFIQKKGSINIEQYSIENSLDIEFKPGLNYPQIFFHQHQQY